MFDTWYTVHPDRARFVVRLQSPPPKFERIAVTLAARRIVREAAQAGARTITVSVPNKMRDLSPCAGLLRALEAAGLHINLIVGSAPLPENVRSRMLRSGDGKREQTTRS